MTTNPAPKPGDTIDRKYEIVEVLGQGGMGVVCSARHLVTGRGVAIKWMRPDMQAEPGALERFMLEAKVMGRIEHPAVVGVMDVGIENDSAYLVMELMRGQSLREYMLKHGRLQATQACAILLPALEGVEAAHRAGVVHRDLKPENLFLAKTTDGKGPTTRVCDFGISKLREEQPGQGLTQTGALIGTPTYMAPEQVGGRAVDVRTDVWALGTILYEILTSKTPFSGETFASILVAIATKDFPPLDQLVPGIPLGLAAAVHKALEKEPDRRYPSVAAFARAIEPYATPGVTFHEPAVQSMAPPPSNPVRQRDSAAETVAGSVRARGMQSSSEAAPVQVSGARRPSAATAMRAATPYVGTTAGIEQPTSSSPRMWIAIGILAVAVVVFAGTIALARIMHAGATDQAVNHAPGALPPPSTTAQEVPSGREPPQPIPSVAPAADTVVGQPSWRATDPPPAVHGSTHTGHASRSSTHGTPGGRAVGTAETTTTAAPESHPSATTPGTTASPAQHGHARSGQLSSDEF